MLDVGVASKLPRLSPLSVTPKPAVEAELGLSKKLMIGAEGKRNCMAIATHRMHMSMHHSETSRIIDQIGKTVIILHSRETVVAEGSRDGAHNASHSHAHLVCNAFAWR